MTENAFLSESVLPIAVRAYAVPHPRTTKRTSKASRSEHAPPTPRAWGKPSPKGLRMPHLVLVLDPETRIDATQRLLFGCWRLYASGPTWRCVDEGLFLGDDLSPDEQARVRRYAATHEEAGEPELGGPHEPLRVLTRAEFLRQLFWPVAWHSHGLVVGFNLPFDLSRLGIHWGVARAQRYAGGFSLALASYLVEPTRPSRQRKKGKSAMTTQPGGGQAEQARGQPTELTETRELRENRYRPRLAIRSIDSKRALIGFTGGRAEASSGGPTRRKSPGHFLDLRTLAFALTNASHSLASACVAFGVEHGKQHIDEHGVISEAYLDYNRRDVQATWELYERLATEFARHPIELPITRAYSPASIGKAYLKALGIRPLLQRQPDFPREVLGFAMAAYYGGRAECRIRRIPVPVVYLDFVSMYPTVCSLMGLWRLLIAERIVVQEATEQEATEEVQIVQDLLAQVSLDACFDPALWPRFVGLVQIVPESDILPVRARYGDSGGSWQIGVNPLTTSATTSDTTSEPLWYTIADVVASTLLTGKPPRVVRALRFAPEGALEGLQPIHLRGQVRVDPRACDFFRTVIEERKQLAQRAALAPEERTRLDAFLKVLANASSYGIYAEMNRQELPERERATVDVYGAWEQPFTARVQAPEAPGAYCFPPFAACIAGAARLMLALLERCVTDAGGVYATCDTDSMTIVATEAGGLVPCPGGAERLADGSVSQEMDGGASREAVRALSWAAVERIRQRFAALNPYDPEAVPGSILKLEEENRDPVTGAQRQLCCYAISAKRYALFNLDNLDKDLDEAGRPILRKSSEHGLGHLLSPTAPDDEDGAWMAELWRGLVSEALGNTYAWPAWLDRPALGRVSVSSPAMLAPFARRNQGKPYAAQVKPFNFLLTAFVAPFGHPAGVDPAHFHLVAPYTSDPRQWERLPWVNLYADTQTDARYRITTTSSLYVTPGVVQVKTYRDVLAEYRMHPEAKSLGPDGQPCGRRTIGLLRRRPLNAAWTAHVGKESNRLEEMEAGLIHSTEEIYTKYDDLAHDPWRTLVLPILKLMPRRLLSQHTGLARSTVTAIRAGRAHPHTSTRATLEHVAATYSRAQLLMTGIESVHGGLAACKLLLAHVNG